MPQDEKHYLLSRRQRRLYSGAAKLHQGVAFIKMPDQRRAKRHRALEAFARGQHHRALAPSDHRTNMWIQDQEDAAVIFAREFANHQRTGTRRSFPMNMTYAVAGHVVAQRVEILATA